MSITEIYIEGLRTIERVRLRLDDLTVLIGDNGAGKSSILEACEILRRATTPTFLDDFHRIHGGLSALLRGGATRLVLGVTVTVADRDWSALRYELELTREGTFARFLESVRAKLKGRALRGSARPPKANVDADGFFLLSRNTGDGRPLVFAQDSFHAHAEADAERTLVATAGRTEDAADGWLAAAAMLADHLRSIQVHLPFEVIPAWAARALDRKSSLRGSTLLAPAERLDRLGTNLASAYHSLKNGFGRDHWEKTLEYVRLGLGQHVEDVVTWADPGGGNVGLSLKLTGLDQPIPTAQISDGMLSYLAFVALFRLDRKPPSLLAFDEPDLHLHPQLLMRVLDLFEAMAEHGPVLLATHSDRLLDGLRSPEKSVVLCDLGPDGTTRLLRPDAATLERWLERYRGLGDIRAAGHAASVLTRPEPA